MSLKPFDIGIDRALKALWIHIRIEVLFGAKLRPLPGDRRGIWGGSKHLFHKHSAPGGQRNRQTAFAAVFLFMALSHQCFALQAFQKPREKRLRLADVKEMFLQEKS